MEYSLKKYTSDFYISLANGIKTKFILITYAILKNSTELLKSFKILGNIFDDITSNVNMSRNFKLNTSPELE